MEVPAEFEELLPRRLFHSEGAGSWGDELEDQMIIGMSTVVKHLFPVAVFKVVSSPRVS